jgi:hypothetical protein
MPDPKLLAMMIKQGIEGDDALLRLAQVRFQEAGLGSELYPGSAEQLRQQLAFCPAGQACTVHLPRGLNLLSPEARARIRDFAVVAAGQAHGLIVHDHMQFQERPDETRTAFREADRLFASVPHAPLLFVEYAAGLTPDDFASLFERTRELTYVSACIDISHVGIRFCQTAYAQTHAGVDVCSLKNAAELPQLMEAVQEVVTEALPVVLDLVRRLALLGKALHFHLHDGHPLSTLSRYGVSDHLGFLQQIRLPFIYQGRQVVGGIYGPAGLRAIIQAARQGLPDNRLSFMIEVHPQEGRSPLGPYAWLFDLWKDRTNAERMNYWLDQLLLNATLLREACGLPR